MFGRCRMAINFTLQAGLDDILKRYRRGCSHEDDIAGDILGDVTRLLEHYNLLSVVDPEQTIAAGDAHCKYCGSRETYFVHRAYCIHMQE